MQNLKKINIRVRNLMNFDRVISIKCLKIYIKQNAKKDKRHTIV